MTNKITADPLTLETFPHLSRLGLSVEELGALARQGFIRREARGNKTVVRMRYRVHGRQRARYVSLRDAAALEAELVLWQREVRARRRLNGLAALARKVLAHRRLMLASLLEGRGHQS